MSSQLVWLYQGDTHLRYLIFNNVYLKMGLYTVLKPSLKGENTNITKNDLKFKFFIFFPPFFFLQKVKNLFRWNMLKEHAQVKNNIQTL